MKATLDGKFFSFSHTERGTSIAVKEVSPDHCPAYIFENQNLIHSKRGAYSRAKMMAARSAKIWNEDRTAELEKLRKLGHGSKKIRTLMGISRGEIEGQLVRMGLMIKRGAGRK